MKTKIVIGLLVGALAACGTAGEAGDTGGTATLGSPPGMMVMEMGSGLHVTWQDTFSTESGFELQRKEAGGEFAKLLDLPANSTEHHDGTVTAGTTYTYRVRAMQGTSAGAWSSEATATAPQKQVNPPGKPTGMMVMRMSGGLHTMWDDNSSDETAFELWRKVGTGEWTLLYTLPANTDNKMDSHTVAGQLHTYKVRAVNGTTDSDWSNEASGTP